MVAEMIREKLTRRLGEELPYVLTIQVDRFEVGVEITEIDATIIVEKEGHQADEDVLGRWQWKDVVQ